MRVNQQGHAIDECQLFSYVGESGTLITDQDRNDAIALLCQHLGVQIWRTNATKHGHVELVLWKAGG